MKPEMPPCLVFPLMAVVGVLCVRAVNAETRSKKLGAAATACGVAGFIPALLGPSFRDPGQSQIIATCGVLTLLCALTAIVLSVWAFRARRDGAAASRYPIVGLLCGVANLLCGSGLLVSGSGVLAPTDGTPWTWQSADHGFEVTVPSERWVTESNPNVLASFNCSRPPCAALVARVWPAGTDAEYQAALAHGMKIKQDTPTSDTRELTDPNRHGHPHWAYMGDAKADKKPYFFGVSVTRVRDKAVLLMFEGGYRSLSDVNHNQEARVIRTQADLFLGSVK